MNMIRVFHAARGKKSADKYHGGKKKPLYDCFFHNKNFLSSVNLFKGQNAFLLSPAPKRSGRYIDTMNLVDKDREKWLSIRRYGYRQKIKKSKTSLYSIIAKFRNTSKKPVTVWCELRDSTDFLLKRTSFELPANTLASEFEIVFSKNALHSRAFVV